MADRQAIDDLFADYAWAMDTRDWDLLRAVFHEEASFTIPITGADTVGPISPGSEVVDFISSTTESQTDQRRHVITNVRVEEETDSGAKATAAHPDRHRQRTAHRTVHRRVQRRVRRRRGPLEVPRVRARARPRSEGGRPRLLELGRRRDGGLSPEVADGLWAAAPADPVAPDQSRQRLCHRRRRRRNRLVDAGCGGHASGIEAMEKGTFREPRPRARRGKRPRHHLPALRSLRQRRQHRRPHGLPGLGIHA